MAEHADASDEELSTTDQAEPEDAEATTGADGTETGAGDAEDYDAAVDADAGEASEDAVPARQPISPVLLATALGLIMVVGFAALAGWFGFKDYQSRQARQQLELLVQVGRQGAVNLTTIDWEHADADIQRILDSATGPFYDDFSKRSKPFVEVVKKAQSKSVGTVTEAGLEQHSGDQAQVLVAVSVTTTSLAGAEPDPRHWRMRISVQKVGDDAKISNVDFVP